VTIGPDTSLWIYDHEKNLRVGAAVLGMGAPCVPIQYPAIGGTAANATTRRLRSSRNTAIPGLLRPGQATDGCCHGSSTGRTLVKISRATGRQSTHSGSYDEPEPSVDEPRPIQGVAPQYTFSPLPVVGRRQKKTRGGENLGVITTAISIEHPIGEAD